MTERIQNAGTEVVEAKAGAGSATLSMAYAAARMAESTLLGLLGEPNMFECAFVDSDVSACRASFVVSCLPCMEASSCVCATGQWHCLMQVCVGVLPQVVPEVPFFATKVQLGKEGVVKVQPLGPLNDFEQKALDAMLPELKAQIAKGIKFAQA